MNATAQVFVKRRFTGSSVEEVSAEATYTRPALYSKFHSEGEVFVDVVHDQLRHTAHAGGGWPLEWLAP